MNKTTFVLTMAAILLIAAHQAQSQETGTKNIPNTAVAAGSFKTLVAALEAADLVETLAGEGPFTVLAPTDEAFAKLPEGTIKSLLKPENKEKLVAILKLHVAAGRLTSEMAETGAEFPTLAGTPLRVNVKENEITVGSATVQKTDIACSNGVIHAIDTVLLPSAAVDPKKLVGNWTYSKAVKDGEQKNADQLDGQTVEITLRTWTLQGEGGKFVMDYEIDSEAIPNKINFRITESPFGAGSSSGGLIKFEGDQLVVCYAARGGDAPVQFESKADSGVHLFHLKKTK